MKQLPHVENERVAVKSDLNVQVCSNDIKATSKYPPLHYYAENGKVEDIFRLISNGCNVNAKNSDGNTPLMCAILSHEDIPTIRLLLNENSDIYVTNLKGQCPLSIVIDKSHTWLASSRSKVEHSIILVLFFEKVKKDFFIDKDSTAKKLQDVNCPLPLILFMEDTTITQYFLDHDFSLDKWVAGLTILQIAVLRGDLDSIKLLVCYDEHLNATDKKQQTTLFYHNPNSEDTNEKIEILKILLDHGASLYIPRNDDVTPLEYLLRNGNIRTVSTVLQSDTNLGKRCEPNGRTALHFLLQNDKIRRDVRLNGIGKKEKCTAQALINLLLRKGVDVNIRDRDGISALTWSVKNHNVSNVELLIKNGCEANWLKIAEYTNMLQIFLVTEYYYNCGSDVDYCRDILELIFREQLDIDIQNLYKDLNKGSTRKINNLFYAKIVISHIAIDEAAGEQISDSIRSSIRCNGELEEHYENCKELIKKLDTIVVKGKVTLLDMLTKGLDEIEEYVYDQDFIAKLYKVMSRKCYHSSYYYMLVIHKRIKSCKNLKKLNKSASSMLCELARLDRYGMDENHFAVYKIISYLDKKDVENMLAVQWLSKDKYRMPIAKNEKRLKKFICKTMKNIIEKASIVDFRLSGGTTLSKKCYQNLYKLPKISQTFIGDKLRKH